MFRSALVLLVLLGLANAAVADVPQTLSYQGELTDTNGVAVSGTLNVTFRIYDVDSGGSALWTEIQSVTFTDAGVFEVVLGSVQPLSLPFDAPYWLSIQIDGDSEMSPRVPLTAAPYSLNLADDTVGATKIQDGAVVRSLNTLTDDVTLVAGANVTISPNGNQLVISASGGGGGADADWNVNGTDMSSAVSGNVGIGTATPGAKLQVESGNDPQLVIRSSDVNGDDAGLVIRGSRNATVSSDAAWIDLRDFDDDEGAGTEFTMGRIGAAMDATSGQRGSLRMYTNGGSGEVERMRIDSTGNVGIGTSDPTAPLEVVGRMELSGTGSRLELRNGSDQLNVELDGEENGGGGYLNIYNSQGTRTIELDGDENGVVPMVRIYTGNGTSGIELEGQESGSSTDGGIIRMFDDAGNVTGRWDGKQATGGSVIQLFDEVGTNTVYIDGNEGDLGAVINLNNDAGLRSIEIDSHEGAGDGVMRIYDRLGVKTVEMNGWQGANGNLNIYNESGVKTVELDAREGEGAGQIELFDATGAMTIEIDADKGGSSFISVDVLQINGGADLSEQFDVKGDHAGLTSAPEPGMVVSIDPRSPGELQVSAQAYDRRVAGVISGAGGVRPGMMLGQKGTIADGEFPVALTGRVYVWADASYGPIEPGDLLTTSDTPGHAMKVDEHTRAGGATLGKAMTALPSGQGLVLVLVSLQ